MTGQALEAALAAAISHYNTGDRGPAEAACREALARHGAHPALDQLLAVLCHERGAAGEALAYADRSLVARPGHGPTLLVAALVRQDLRDFEGAARALEAVLQQQPQHVAARVNLGIVRLEQGRLDDALDAFGRAYLERPETFGRIANALTSSSTGALWTSPGGLRDVLAHRAPPTGS
jgi:tetratricopeptide (TPR) repeat protein